MDKKKVLIVAVVFLGVFLRIFEIGKIPPGLHGDEAQTGIEALKILNGEAYSPYSPEVYGQTTLHFYFTALIFKLLGPTAVAIRVASVIVGIITIPAFYFFVKSFWGWRVSVLATFFLAVSRWHLHLSRLGFMTIDMILFQILALWFLLKGLKEKNSVWNMILSGIFMGIGLNTYMGFRLMVPVIFLIALIHYGQRRKFSRGDLWRALLFFVSFLLTSLPLLIYAIRNWEIFNGRMRSVWIFSNRGMREGLILLWENFKGVVLMFNFRGTTWAHKNLPGAPMLDFVSGLFFVIGLLILLRKAGKLRNSAILINFIIMLLPSVLTVSAFPPSGDPIRSAGLIPSVMIACGLGLDFLWRKFEERRKFVAGGLLILTFLVISLLQNTRDYFFIFPRNKSVWRDFHIVPFRIAEFYNDFNNKPKTFLVSDWFYIDYETIKFVSPGLASRGHNFFESLAANSPKNLNEIKIDSCSKDFLFLLTPSRDYFLESLKLKFPEGESRYHYIGWGNTNELGFISYLVPCRH